MLSADYLGTRGKNECIRKESQSMVMILLTLALKFTVWEKTEFEVIHMLIESYVFRYFETKLLSF